jgi:hypothetical protein
VIKGSTAREIFVEAILMIEYGKRLLLAKFHSREAKNYWSWIQSAAKSLSGIGSAPRLDDARRRKKFETPMNLARTLITVPFAISP